jgi:DNA-binding response OmpR family regulator
VTVNRVVVLLVDADDTRAMYTEYLTAYLHTFGFTILTAGTLDDGLRRAGDADVVLTGIHVPRSFDGGALVRRLRDAAAPTQMPIVVLAPCVCEADQPRAHAAGCDVSLPESSLPERLVSDIRAALRRRTSAEVAAGTRVREPTQSSRLLSGEGQSRGGDMPPRC